MSEHFIKEIEIKNFKCFEDFKADGFKRVNLIGGKNNVGKSAFMEGCYLLTSTDVAILYNKLLEINTHRNVINQLLDSKYRNEDIKELILQNREFNISSNINNISIIEKDGFFNIKIKNNEAKDNLANLMSFLDTNISHTKINNSIHFISQNSNVNHFLNTIIDDAKLENKLDILNKYLQDLFKIESIDTIKYKPFIKSNNQYKELSQFGQGIKTFIHIISSILLLKNDYIFVDEIDNGIHYTLFDDLWEIILTISKEQNVQVFATTHSKEMIESFYRVSKKLEEDDISFIELGKNKENKIKAIVMDSERFNRNIDNGNGVRGW